MFSHEQKYVHISPEKEACAPVCERERVFKCAYPKPCQISIEYFTDVLLITGIVGPLISIPDTKQELMFIWTLWTLRWTLGVN